VTAVPEEQVVRQAVRRLDVQLDAPLPGELAVGRGTALFVAGWCFCLDARIRSLSLIVDGQPQAVMEHGMPRLDVMRALHPGVDPYGTGGMESDPASEEDPNLLSYRSGFWGMARLLPREGNAPYELKLHAELEGGGSATADLGTIEVAELEAPAAIAEPEPEGGPLVAICMATYEPPLELFRRQVESIRAQTHGSWVCVISDDCSSARAFAALAEVVGDDPRFVISRSPRRLGFYGNFERALSLAPEAARYVAMADQDDRWLPEKLETLVARIGDSQLIYSDARVVRADGEVVSETYWSRRRNNHSDVLSLLVANAVTGAASLFRRDLLDYALPFPPAQFAHFHDHWIGLTALALGDIAFCDRPLYDYVQHGDASLGHAAANRMPALRERLGSLRRDPRERVRMWRMHYFVDVCRLMQFATVLQMRCGERMAPGKRRVLDRFLRTDRSLPALARLWARGARELVGRPETLGAEWMLSHAFAWRRALSATTRDRPQRGLRLDAVPPPSLAPRPGRRVPAGPGPRAVSEKIAPLELAVRDDAPRRVNLLIPTIDLEHFFGGYIAKFNLARRLAEHGVRVRIVTVDPVAPLPRSWKRQLEAYSGLAGVFDHVEVAFGREARGLEVSREDRFVATTWWSAHIAASAARALGDARFLYLIQEYEPFTFPMGSYAALARQSYDFPHFGLYSTELLREYFRLHGIGVYADGTAVGDQDSVSFENAITAIRAPSAAQLAARGTRRLLFYARPEPHAARNMFEMGVLALTRAVELGVLHGDWELHGIGTLDSGRRLELADGVVLELLPRSEQGEYARVLGEHDVGLSLMYTPHPSLVPIEMASAGMLTVTNSFENKTPEALAAISANLITAEPTVDAIAAALAEATAGSGDFERRARGSAVNWSRDWNQSFGDELMARLTSFLE
jgi:glycosyltransferase involved in cell wall biosynthesis